VVNLRSELLPHEVPITLMVGLVVIITGHQPVLYQGFEVIFGHTGEGFGHGIPRDRDTGKVTVYRDIAGGRQHQMAEEVILPPRVPVPIRFQRVIQPPTSNEVCGNTNIGFAFPWEDLPSLGGSGVLVTVNNLTDMVWCPLLYHTTDPYWETETYDVDGHLSSVFRSQWQNG
jgi:hypothetical protein